MPDISHHSADNPEFARVLEVARLRGLETFSFDLSATPEESAALARLLDARTVRKLRFQGVLRPSAGTGWTLEGKLGVTVVQACVVTLEPVTTRLDLDVRRQFLPQASPKGTEVTLEPLDEDETEPLADRIDLGLVAVESIVLNLPSYPRAEGAELGEAVFAAPGERPLRDAEVKPFSALAALKDKLGNNTH
jgi:uncharacterized metal-binding protein YceD (DUF177 family)